jgi:hypothetical protein
MKYLFILALFLTASVSSQSQNLRKMRECVVINGQLKEIEIDYNPGTGERSLLVNGVRKEFYSQYPKSGPDYAEGQTWFINSENIVLKTRKYQKYGLPRVLGVNEIVKTDVYKGVGVYTEAGLTGPADVIYIPVRQGCEFQPYQVVCGYIEFKELAKTASTRQVRATVTGLKGKISYKWSSDRATITKGQGTPLVTVNFSEMGTAFKSFDLTLTVKDAQNCPVYTTKYIVVRE